MPGNRTKKIKINHRSSESPKRRPAIHPAFSGLQQLSGPSDNQHTYILHIYKYICFAGSLHSQHPRTTMAHRSSPVNTRRFFCADVQLCMSPKMYAKRLFGLVIVSFLVCQAGGRTFEGIPGFGRNLIVRSLPPVPDFQSNLYEVYMEPLLFVRILFDVDFICTQLSHCH